MNDEIEKLKAQIRNLEARLSMMGKMENALHLIAAPMRPDGTWNRSRLACQKLAKEALNQ